MMKTIYDFKKDDIIVRIKPAKSLGPIIGLMGETIETCGDRSYMGEKLVFMGIANSQIYLKRTSESDIIVYGNELIDLPLDLFDEGWDKWVDPKQLFEQDDTVMLSKSGIKDQLKIALQNENYELAEKLQEKLDKL